MMSHQKSIFQFSFCPLFLCISLCLVSRFLIAQDTLNFLPPSTPQEIRSREIHSEIVVNGRLDDPAWDSVQSITHFFRMEPRQGGTPKFKTFVKILHDEKNLYFGVFCKDELGTKGIRAQDFRRDFTVGENDAFGIQLDPQDLKRFCASFQATPLGTQLDLQVFDDQLRDTNWDALWKVRTTRTDSGYVAEFAIPFKSLRYEKPSTDSVSWNITLVRIARRDYEQTVFPSIPQAWSPFRMTYAAKLKGLKLPPPSINLRAQPYALFQTSKVRNTDGTSATDNSLKAGGDIKWAVKANTVLDLTVNTDFAQADVDRAVNNLTRFNVQFPERRQFFLENQGVFAGANVSAIKPFFSRTIGLSSIQFNSDPIPIDVGIRFTDRTQQRTIAGLYVRQRDTDLQPAANFAVMRYLYNYGVRNNVGGMLTHRYDQDGQLAGGSPAADPKHNSTVTLDGLIRPSEKITLQYLASASRDNSRSNIGNAGSTKITYRTNKFFFYYLTNWVDEKYKPGMGFVFQNNVIHHQTVQFFAWRPLQKKLRWIREWEIGFDIDHYQNFSDFKPQQTELYIYPVYIILKNGGLIQYAIFPTWQHINFDFAISGIPIPKGEYYYNLHRFDYRTDQSRKLALNRTTYIFGKYYNGEFNSFATGLRVAPIPNIAFTVDYTWNRFIRLGEQTETKETSLYTAGLRLAVNPRIQASIFYEYNSLTKLARWNVRTSWEFAPLSFVYLVFNDNNFTDSLAGNRTLITKVTYVKQF